MEVQLREMSMEEFKVFSENSIFDYANDLVKSSGITMDEALIQAQEEFAGMLPNALETKNNILRVIVDVSEQKTVGVIWYLFEVTDGVKQIFLNDFIINWKHNSPGINLYTKCGYVAFRELDDGMYMKKGIKG